MFIYKGRKRLGRKVLALFAFAVQISVLAVRKGLGIW